MACGCQFAISAKAKEGKGGFIQGLRQESSRRPDAIQEIPKAVHMKEHWDGERLETVKRETPGE